MSATIALEKQRRSMVGKAITVIKYVHACFASTFPCAMIFRFDAVYAECWVVGLFGGVRVYNFAFHLFVCSCDVCMFWSVFFFNHFSHSLSLLFAQLYPFIVFVHKVNETLNTYSPSLSFTLTFIWCYHLPVNIYVLVRQRPASTKR